MAKKVICQARQARPQPKEEIFQSRRCVVYFNLTHNVAMSTGIYFLVGDSVEAKITSPCSAVQRRLLI